jgi:hypothetical protein
MLNYGGDIMKAKPKIRVPVAVNQHSGIHKDKKKEKNKYACRKEKHNKNE